MFADSLLDSALISRSHRGWTTLISFSVQALLVAALLMVPLLYTEGLPPLHLMRPEVIGPPPSRGPAPKIEPSQGRNPMLKSASGLVLMIPQQIPKGVAPRTDVLVGPPPELATGGSTSGPGGPGVPNGILSSTGDANVILIPPRPVHHPPISHWMEGNLIHRLQPAYPPWQFKPAHKVKSCCAQSSPAKGRSKTCRWSAVIPCWCGPLLRRCGSGAIDLMY